MNVSRIINLALKQLGVLAAGENAKADETADAVDSLRALLAQWATEQLYVYKCTPITINLTGPATYTLSQSIQAVSDIAKLDDEETVMVRDVNNTGNGIKVIYTEQQPYWKFQVLCDAQKLEIKAYELPITLSSHDELELPPKYERAFILSLALELAPMFVVEPTPTLVRNQQSAITLLKNSNSPPVWVNNELPVGVCYGDNYGYY